MTSPSQPTTLRERTLLDVLWQRAEEEPNGCAYSFLGNGEEESDSLTFGELDQRARVIGGELRRRGLAGERVLLLYPPGLDFVTAFFGCLHAGAVAVPAYPPHSERNLPRLQAIVADAQPRGVLAPQAALPALQAQAGRLAALADVQWLGTDGLDGPPLAPEEPGPGPEDLAFLQYTSGSTAAPKGVMVTHANLLHNEETIRRGFGLGTGEVIVGWLPLYHDMGLIGNVIQPLYTGGSCVLMSPVAFLQRPWRWLEAISRHGGTVSGGPNFAYELCLRRISAAEREKLDLSRWRLAFNGAEPIRAETLERFAAVFAPCGFRREAFYPCYGLAEATLFVTGARPGAGIVTVSTNPGSTDLGDTGPAHPRVSSGRAEWGPEVRIVDPETATRRPEGEVGEIWVRGESVAAGYWGRPEATAETFGARLAGDDGGPYLRTGDLGFLRAGELFVTGRIKDLIILRGRNHYPQDLELTAERAHPALRPGCGAAFAVEPQPGVATDERVVLVFEVDRHSREPVEEIARAVRQAIAEEHEIPLGELVLIRQGTLPKTSSGKVQRQACRRLYLAAELAEIGRSGTSSPAPGRETAAESWDEPAAVASLAGLAPDERRARLERYLAAQVREQVGSAPPDLLDLPLTSLGLDSLAAVELQHRVETDLGSAPTLSELLAGATVRELARRLSELPAGEVAETQAAAGEPEEPGESAAAPGPASLWFVERLAGKGAVYNLAMAATFEPGLDLAAFERAWLHLAARHPALRTTFVESSEGLRQRLRAEPRLDMAKLDGAKLAGEADLGESLAAAALEPFDLEQGPLLRLRHRRLPDDKLLLLLVLHHSIADFWSLGVLLRELGSLLRGETLPAPPPSPFAAYREQSAHLAGSRGEELWSFWQRQLAPPLPLLDLPLDRPRPAVLSYRGAAAVRRLPVELAAAASTLARTAGTTLFTVLLAAFQGLLARLSGARRVLLGSPAAARDGAAFAGTVGYLVNPLVLAGEVAGEEPFAALLARARETVLAALAHQDLPFPVLAERLGGTRDAGRSPLFDVLFVLDRSPLAEAPGLAALAAGLGGVEIELGGLRFESVELLPRRAPFDLTLRLVETVTESKTTELAAVLTYATDLFDATTVERWLASFEVLLAAALRRPETHVGRLDLLAEAERAQLLGERAGGPAHRALAGELPLLPSAFFAQAAATPEATAASDRDEWLSYGELARRVTRVAAGLRERGIGPEVRVAVRMERTVGLVTGLLGVLAAGGAYVPIDPAYPAERQAFMESDSGAQEVLTDALLASLLAGPEPAGAPALVPPALAESLAYLIYTSGSTGRPKAVAVPHRSVAALLAWAARAFADEELTAVLAATSVCFDISVFELFVPLARGGRVLVVANVLEAAELPAATGVTLINTVPSPMAELLRLCALPARLRTVNLAGEPLAGELAARVYAHGRVSRLLNLYGPSEDTVFSTIAEIGRDEPRPSIGRPIDGSSAFVLDRWGGLAASGVPGELYLGGRGLSRGYLGRPALTAERFLPDPFGPVGSGEPGDRLYRTGDLVRFRPGGELDFLGRVDQQVKVRGFRVELGEIEAVLGHHPAVAECAVAARLVASGDRPSAAEGERQLVAYWVPRSPATAQPPSEAELASFLRTRLPAFAVPALFVGLPFLPRTASGKLDRRGLPEPVARQLEAPDEAPRSAVEEILIGVFEDLLGVRGVGIGSSFFELGGHSLLATRLVSRVRDLFAVELPLVTVLEAPTVADLAARIQEPYRLSLPIVQPIEPVARGGSFPLSFAQERLWLASQRAGQARAYHVPLAVRLEGDLQVAALRHALAALVTRHEALRTVFPMTDDGPIQQPLPRLRIALPVVDLAGLDLSAGLAAQLAEKEARGLFDLARGPLLRARLLRLSAREHHLLITLHHLVADGWSLGVMIREIPVAYRAALGEPAADEAADSLPALPIQVADHAVWERRQLAHGAYETDLAYWRDELAGLDGGLDLPRDRPRAAGAAAPPRTGAVVERTLSPALAAPLHALARREGATLFMVLLAAFDALLFRLSGQRDLAVGTPIANRRSSQLEGLVGCFVNTLVLRVAAAEALPFTELLARVRQASLGAYTHQALPFERLVEVLQPPRDAAHTPFFQALFVLQNVPLPELALPGLAVTLLPTDAGAAQFDLSLAIREDGERLLCAAEHATELFDRTTVTRWLAAFETLLGEVVAAPAGRLGDLSLLAAAERAQLLGEWNDRSSVAAEPAIDELILATAARQPEALALAGQDGEMLSYGELAARVSRLAARLAREGVGPEARVGVFAGRSPDAIVAFLAVLAAGGAYVPIDPTYPEPRIALLVEDAGLRWVVAGRRAIARWASLRWPAADPNARPAVTVIAVPQGVDQPEDPPAAGRFPPASAAYVLYTSGSTGRPKGVVIPRAALTRYSVDAAASYGLEPADRALQLAALSFDASAEEIYPTLLRGALLRLRDDAMLSSLERFAERLAAWQITVLNLPTALWHQLVAALAAGEIALPPTVRLAVIGGEKAQPEPLATWRELRSTRLVNTYGPTEATIVATASEQGRQVGAAADVEPAGGDLGRPIAGRRVYVAGRRLQPVPLGATGELLIGSSDLARGYLGRPALTAERFLPDPWSGEPGSRLLATGDLARALPDGSLAFAGRSDRQVKVRGFRVELAEIESALGRLPGVREAVVVAREVRPGDLRLLAYVVPAPEAPPPAGLRDRLAEELPAYMLPSALTFLPALPLTAHGKLAERALPLPEAAQPDTTGPGGAALALEPAPRELTPTEEILAGIWSEVLGIDLHTRPLHPESDFFALGGHSLLATQVGSRLRRRLGVELPFDTLFAAPTLGALAAAIETALTGEPGRRPEPIPPAPGDGPWRLSYSQERLWFLDRLYHGSPFYNLAGGLHLAGPLDLGRMAACLAALVERHEALRTRFGVLAGEARQWVENDVRLATPLLDLSALPPAARDAVAREHATRFDDRPFELRQAPLLRVLFVRRGAEDHDLRLVLHHIVGDAWTLANLSRELTALYAADGSPAHRLPPLAIRYGDFAEWQREHLTGETLAALLGYWRERLRGAPPESPLPADRPRPPVQGFAGAVLPFALSPALGGRLAALAQARGITLFMALLAAFDVLLLRLSGQTDLVVGTNVAHRNRHETEGVVGFFVNTLVLRCDLGGDPTFGELLARVRATTLGAYAHQDLPFNRLVQELEVRRDPSRNPLFQVMFLLQNTPALAPDLAGLEVRPIAPELRTAVFDLTLALEETPDGGLAGTARYSTALFDEATIATLISRFVTLLEQVVERPEERLSRFALPMTPLSATPPLEPPAPLAPKKDEIPMKKEQKLAKLLSLKPKSFAPAGEALVRIAPLAGRDLPLAIEPAIGEVDLAGWVAGHRREVEDHLARHGAVLFRGFGITTLAAFEEVARALSGRLVQYGERSSPRTALAEAVYTSTDHPADQPIVMHNEQSYTLNWPLKIWFGCLQPARAGGATPLADSRRILARLPAPLVERFERLQVMYVRNYGDGLGLTWQQAFQTSDPAVVEEHCRAADIEVIWKADGRLRTRQVRPAVRRHPKTGEAVWFNHAVFFHVSSLDPRTRDALLAGMAEEDLPFNTLYGDGTAIEPDVLDTLRAAIAAEVVTFPWQLGDALLVDNMLVAHGREPFEGPRKVVVAMAEPAEEWLAGTLAGAPAPASGSSVGGAA